MKAQRALEVFNAGEHPRRVAGVARSLGAPSVTVRPLAESGSAVTIVVAWELCGTATRSISATRRPA